MYIAPVFTGLEYVSFESFGVGVRQARLVSELTGFASVLLLALGVARLGGRAAGGQRRRAARDQLRLRDVGPGRADGSLDGRLHGRGWYCYVRARRDAALGLGAAACALLAFFTKAAAAFFVAALGSTRSSPWLDASGRETRSGGARGRARDACRAGGVRCCRACGVRAAELDRLPVLQLADVGHAQAELRPEVARSIASRGFQSCTTSSRACGSRSCVGMTAALGLLARWRDGLRRRAAAGLLGGGWCGRTDPARRRQRAPLPVLHSGARRAGGARARARPDAPSGGGLGNPRSEGAARAAGRPVRRCTSIGGTLVRLAHLYEVGPNVRAGGGTGGGGEPPWSTRPGPGLPRQLAGRRGPRLRRAARGRARLGGPTRAVRPVGCGTDLQELRRLSRARPTAAAGHAGPRQAGQRPRAREPDQADLRRPRLRQLRGPEDARRCAIYSDVRRAEPRIRVAGAESRHSGRARRVPGSPRSS